MKNIFIIFFLFFITFPQHAFSLTYDKKTNKDLLNALLHFYKEHKSKDNDYVLTFHNFIDMFPRDTMKTLKFKRQHVFEAICKLLLVLDINL